MTYRIVHPSYSSETIMRFDYQILLKSPPKLNLLAGSATAWIALVVESKHVCVAFCNRDLSRGFVFGVAASVSLYYIARF